ncbi:MAG TPA: FAD-binding protein [Steroidobacteraceae bacterium]|nr:FAD-binding protein [Steroidobacteraceae bacterium]
MTVQALQPADEAEIAQILGEGAQALEVVGGGSRRDIGRPVTGRRLELSRLNGILDYQPRELVLTARAGTPLSQVNAVLAGEGQRLAFEPPDGGVGGTPTAPTLGGIIASNWSGPRRLSAGAARDHFLGFRAVNGRGERFAGGSRVVKNVTGYDVPKLLAGSWGTLAVLTEVCVRVVPAAEQECSVLLPPATPAQGAALCARALGSVYEVSAAAVLPERGVALRLEGLAASVRTRASGLLSHLRPCGHELLEGEASRQLWRAIGEVRDLAGLPVIWRVSVAPTEAARVIGQLSPRRFLLDWAGGLMWLGFESVDEVRVRGALAGGHATLVRAPPEARRRCPSFQPPGALAPVIAAVKAAFDPRGLLNPGRME